MNMGGLGQPFAFGEFAAVNRFEFPTGPRWLCEMGSAVGVLRGSRFRAVGKILRLSAAD